MTALSVLIVDDSSVIRGVLTRELSNYPFIKVVDTASDGKMAIDFAENHKPDIILLDIQMPIMDGITAIPFLLKSSPESKIIIVSSHALHNAPLVLEALNKGAVDYIIKPEKDSAPQFYQELASKVSAIGNPKMGNIPQNLQVSLSIKPQIIRQRSAKQKVHALTIASSTGGPRTLMDLFSHLKGKISGIPIFITQHMQSTFTPLFAEQLGHQSGFVCEEAKDGEIIHGNKIYIAPGDFHMLVERIGNKAVIKLSKAPPVNSCRPAADPMFISLSDMYRSNLLVAVLTGMGQDGAQGAKEAYEKGATVIAQDMNSSIVYGMPKAVAELGICDAQLPTNEIASYIVKALSNG